MSRNNIFLNLPNLISFARLLSVPLTVWLLLNEIHMTAFWVFIVACVSDAADGFLWAVGADKTYVASGYSYFTVEIIYFWINLGVIPFWLILIFFPQSYLSRFLVTSVLPFIILGGVYLFILYKSYLVGYDFNGNFSLYLGLSELSRLFEDDFYILMFWTHFVAINLFAGGWIVKDSQKFSINKILLAIPLLATYLIGPIGLVLYWIIRIFYAKRINLYE